MQRRILSVLTTLSALYLGAVNVVYAAVPTIIIESPNTGFSDIGQLVQTLVNWGIALGAVATLIYIIIGAFQYVTAGDDAKKTDAARATITNGVIGLVILASAWGIFQILIKIIPGLGNIFK